MSLLSWWKNRGKRKEKRQQNLLNRGFDYALGAIVRGEKTLFELDAERYRIDGTESRNQFDNGIDKAIAYAVQHGLVKDGRMW